MNFLAHAYLSFNHPEILVGNMISDFVKGKKKFGYSKGIQQGIHLHRQIDNFTDTHEATREARTFLKPAVGLYSGAFVDVAYDRFLANDKSEFTEVLLQRHTARTYAVLNEYLEVLPPVFSAMLPHMENKNWLYNYRSLSGIQRSFEGVAKRASYLHSSTEVFGLFQEHYLLLQKCYNEFFPFVKAFTILELEHLNPS